MYHGDDDVDPLFLAALIQLELSGGLEGKLQRMIILMASFGLMASHILARKEKERNHQDESLTKKTSSFFRTKDLVHMLYWGKVTLALLTE